MNILFITTHFNTGGIASYILTLAKALRRLGHNVFVATSGGNKVEELEFVGAKHFNVNLRTKSELSPKIYFSLPVLGRLVRENDINIIHAQTRITQVAASFLSKMTKRPYVSTCHGFFKKRLSRKIFPCWGNGVIAISEAVREHLIKDFGVDAKKIALIYNGIDLREFPPVDDTTQSKMRAELKIARGPVIGIIARLSDVKGHNVLISAMKKIVSQIPSVVLLIVGEGKMEEALKRQTKNLGLEDYIRFYPIVNRTSVMLSLMDIFVMPSLQEGLGLSVMEAQAMGLAVVASRVGGIPSLIEDGKTGILVSPGHADELADALIHLLNEPKKAKEIGQRARQWIERNFSVDEMAAKTASFYQCVVKDYEKNLGG